MKMDPVADLGLLEHIRGRVARIEEYTKRGKITVIRLSLGAGRRNTQPADHRGIYAAAQ